jgi:pimeloyl-ACP methyl ester carboxylesterase
VPTARVNDVDIYYEAHGQGEPLFLIAGLGANATLWETQIPVFAEEFRVVAFDNRGAGRSEKPPGPYSMALFADDTVALMDLLEIGAAHVYGESMGGMIAQEVALRHPQRVRSLVLGCTTFGGPQAVPPPQELLPILVSLAALSPEEALDQGSRIFYHASRREDMKRRLQAYVDTRTTPEAYQMQLEACIAFDSYERLPRIGAPTLVINGDGDAILPAENSRTLSERIPGAELVLFPDSGHLYFHERPAEAASAVLEFLRRQKSGG